MDRIYDLLLAAGYPERGVDWLRRHRLTTIVILALASWGLFIGVGWIIWTALTQLSG